MDTNTKLKIEEKIESKREEYAKVIEKMNELDKEFRELNTQRLQIESVIDSLTDLLSENEVSDTDDTDSNG